MFLHNVVEVQRRGCNRAFSRGWYGSVNKVQGVARAAELCKCYHEWKSVKKKLGVFVCVTDEAVFRTRRNTVSTEGRALTAQRSS